MPKQTRNTLVEVDGNYVWMKKVSSEPVQLVAEKSHTVLRPAEQPILRDTPGEIIMEVDSPPATTKRAPSKPRQPRRTPIIKFPSLARMSALERIDGPRLQLPDKSEIVLSNGEPREGQIVVKLGLERWFSIMDRKGRRNRNGGPITTDKIRIIKAFGEGVVKAGDRLAGPNEPYDVLVMLQGYRDLPEWDHFSSHPRVIYINGDWFVINKRNNRFFQVSFARNPADPRSCSIRQTVELPPQERIDEILHVMGGLPVHSSGDSRGKDILVLPNATKGYGHDGHDPIEWSTEIIRWLLDNTGKLIWFRQHPRDEQVSGIVRRAFPGNSRIMYSDKSQPLEVLLNRIGAAVVHNTTASIPLVMRGVPFVYTGREQIAATMGDTDLKNIERLKPYNAEDRRRFLYSLFKYVWTEEEMRSGRVWKEYRKELTC